MAKIWRQANLADDSPDTEISSLDRVTLEKGATDLVLNMLSVHGALIAVVEDMRAWSSSDEHAGRYLRGYVEDITAALSGSHKAFEANPVKQALADARIEIPDNYLGES
ncbi:hypothetical protein EGT29_19635 [Pigmentiphaga sp. H8]|uniref:hypothetical protein n=1 Tax=Pigmentiphaga sp. H8 TaxID=2488560 RepID=UPI000F598E8A|nr:hypothetical protein [Pigmentiphaga sp. H8]AZG09891.1 hypothetical protein EGT29_19635 [Pigmentiphaga sp. H8]